MTLRNANDRPMTCGGDGLEIQSSGVSQHKSTNPPKDLDGMEIIIDTYKYQQILWDYNSKIRFSWILNLLTPADEIPFRNQDSSRRFVASP